MKAIITNISKGSAYAKYLGKTFEVKEVLSSIVALQIYDEELQKETTVDFSFNEVFIVDIEKELEENKCSDVLEYCKHKGIQVEQIKTITSGSIVSYKDGYYRVTSRTKTKCNLGSIFGKTIYHKGVDISEVVESHDEWYKNWQQSESYMCM